MNSYERGVALDAQWEREDAAIGDANQRRAAFRVRSVLMDPPRLVTPLSRFGLARPYVGTFYLDHLGNPKPPWGWGKRREPGRDLLEIMPLWLLWLTSIDRYVVFPWLICLGFWRCGEAWLYVDGYPSLPAPIARIVRAVQRSAWCFLNDRDDFVDRMERTHGPIGGTWGLSSTTFPVNRA